MFDKNDFIKNDFIKNDFIKNNFNKTAIIVYNNLPANASRLDISRISWYNVDIRGINENEI